MAIIVIKTINGLLLNTVQRCIMKCHINLHKMAIKFNKIFSEALKKNRNIFICFFLDEKIKENL